MAWLTRDGEVLASLEATGIGTGRLRQLMAGDPPEGAFLVRSPLVLHTMGLGRAIDVAFCDAELTVLTTLSLDRWRLARPRPRTRQLLIARAGAFERWGLAVGDHLEVKGA
jgi:hypothetical protein